MKTNFVRHFSLGLAAGLTFFLGCARPSAQTEQSRAVGAPSATPVFVAQAAPTGGTDPAPPPGNAAPAIIERIPPSAKPETVPLSPGLSEVVKLAQAGVGEEVMLAYVDKYNGSFSVGSDQILYLNDLGVSGTVITSMLKHDGSSSAVASAPPAGLQPQPAPNAPETPVVEAPLTPPQVTTAVAPPPTSPEVSYFYDSLSPYGSWVYLSGYGWCWQPTVAVSYSTWRPYCDRGRWYYSDAGWYWNSDYSWGWAAFHYGRWYHHSGCGWVWTPGVEWGPSWVSWRHSEGYAGWAPLPPEAHFVHGAGFTYFGAHVSVGFEFGLRDFHYAFVDIGHFCDYAPYRHVVPRTTVNNFYRNTTVVNNYVVGNNNTVINHGIGRETIARSSQTRIREVSVREAPVQNLASVRGERIERQGNQSVVVRPQLPKTPPPVKTADFVRHGNGQSSVAGRSTTAGAAALSAQPATGGRVQTGVGTRAVTESTPGSARAARAGTESHPGRPVANPQPNTGGTTVQRSVPGANPQPRSQPQPQQQQRASKPLFGDSGANSTPQQNNTTVARAAQPSITPAPRVQPQTQPPVRTAPFVPAQPNYNAPATRGYPPTTAPAQPQPSARIESRGGANTTMSPRGYEQAPRAATPTYSVPAAGGAPAAPRSEARQAPASSGSSGASRTSGQNDSGSGRSERSGRNH